MEYRVVITVGKPPNGRPKIVENTIPAKAPGGDVLAKLASGLKPSRAGDLGANKRAAPAGNAARRSLTEPDTSRPSFPPEL